MSEPSEHPSAGSTPEIDNTAELGRRPARPPDHAAECRALVTLARQMADSPRSILQGLADSALGLSEADSAVVSLLEADPDRPAFRWHAAAGAYVPHVGVILPRGSTPSGIVLDRDLPLLVVDPARHFPGLAGLTTPIVEALLIPLRRGAEPIGTLWVVSHDPAKRFDAEDLRLVSSLADFASAALRTLDNLDAIEEGARRLADAQSRLDAALEAGAIATWTWDILNDRLVADRNLARLFSVSPEDAAGGGLDAYLRAIHPDDRGRVAARIAEVARSGGPYAEQYRVVLPDGSARWVEARGKGIADEAGAIVALPGVIVDITDHKRVEAARASAEDFQRLIFESVKDVSIFATDLRGVITSWNQGAENVFGYRESEIIGRSAAIVFTPEDRAAGIPAREMREAAETGRGNDERWHLRKDGGRFFASGMVRPLRDASGTLIGFTKVARDITAAREAEQGVRRSEERFRTLFESIDEGFCILQMRYDAEGRPEDYRFLVTNPAFEHLIRVANPDGRWVSEVIPGIDRGWHERYGRIARTGVPERFERSEDVLQGRTFTVYAFRIGEPGEDTVAVLFNDITELKRNEAALRKSELRSRLAIESAKLGIFEWDPETDHAEWENDRCFEIFGRTHADGPVNLAEMTGSVSHPEDVAIIARAMDELRETGRYHHVGRFHRPDGTTGWLEVTGQVEPAGAGPRPSLMTGTLADITDRKEAEIAARRRAGQLQGLAEIASRVNAAHDVNSVLGLITEEGRLLIGAHHAATTMILNPAHPQPLNVFSHSPDRQGSARQPNIDGLDLYEAVKRANGSVRLTAGQLDSSAHWSMLGKVVATDVTLNGWLATPLVDHDGRSMGLIQLADKVDGEFTEDDEAILTQLSRIASIAVENARLYEELRDNDNRKDEFLAMLAHELRNPLGAISSGVQLVQQTRNPELLAQLREMIQEQVRHLTHLIDDLLDVSRITQSKIELRKETVDLAEVVRRATDLAKSQVAEKNHRLAVDLPDRPVLFVADATRVEQVLNNLLTNAAKYSDPGRSITLRAGVEGDFVVLRVADEGFGISPEMLPRVFGLFTQVDATIDRARGGLGIGLTLVKSLVEMHGGTVEARSEGKGKGSEFTVRLPIGRPDLATVASRLEDDRPRTGSGKVLVVDDNLQTARLTARMLANAGFAVETAHDGLAAVELARSYRPSVLLLDIGLPGMNGYDVAETLRRDDSCKGALMIAVSGYGEEKARDRSRSVGFDHHLTKPLDFHKLMTLIGDPPA